MKRLAIVSTERVNIDKYLSGQEYYLHTLVKVLNKFGIDVKILTISEALNENYEVFHLYYLSLKDIIKLRTRHKSSKLVYHIYHIDDATWTRFHAFSWKGFIIAIQTLIDAYLLTARSIYSWIRYRAPLSKHILAEPYYECVCGSFSRLPRVVESKFAECGQLKFLYIGRVNPYRFPFRCVVDVVKNLGRKIPVKLTIVSKLNLPFRRKIVRKGNVTIEVINDRILEQEKCELYREHHFFLYPATGNVAMNPPITLLEAVYHGCIPIVTPFVLGDLDFPEDLVVRDIRDIPYRIMMFLDNIDRVIILSKKLRERFERFYDIHRFLRAIRQAL